MYREETEELLVLMQIHFEISNNVDVMREVVILLRGAELGQALFVLDKAYRGKVFEDVGRIRFPATNSVIERLHYLDRGVSGRLLRAIGMVGYIQEMDLESGAGDMSEWFEEVHDSLLRTLPLVIDDLTVVRQACAGARVRLAINRSGETD